MSNVNPLIRDTLIEAARMDWRGGPSGPSWVKPLWAGPDGQWAVLSKWRKGFVHPSHKHLAPAHTYFLKGAFEEGGLLCSAGDYVYTPAGTIHRSSTALEDTEFLFISEGPIAILDGDDTARYLDFEFVSSLLLAA